MNHPIPSRSAAVARKLQDNLDSTLRLLMTGLGEGYWLDWHEGRTPGCTGYLERAGLPVLRVEIFARGPLAKIELTEYESGEPVHAEAWIGRNWERVCDHASQQLHELLRPAPPRLLAG